jgi:hypothetical protein
LQDDKTGALNFRPASGANLLATLQAVPALKGATLVHVPLVPAWRRFVVTARRKRCPSPVACSRC